MRVFSVPILRRLRKSANKGAVAPFDKSANFADMLLLKRLE